MKVKALDLEPGYNVSALIMLWYKIQGNESLMLTDVPELISYRWSYFRDNWDFLVEKYYDKVDSYVDPQLLVNHIVNFDEFITNQRTLAKSKNPLLNKNTQDAYHAIFDVTGINDLILTYEEQIILDNKIQTVSSYGRNDFIALRETVIQQRDDFTDYVDATDETYNETYDRSPTDAQISMTTKHINILQSYQNLIVTITYILANIYSLNNATIDPFALARANANNPAVDIGKYASGYLTKLNYQESLQALAERTLGDPDKWIDIAIANGLKPPYIDETGERISLLATASGNQINIAETDSDGNLNIDKIYINQVVLLQSNTLPFPEQRVIVNIQQIPVSNELIIELDGDSDLSAYTLNDDAHVRIFAPGTINSSFYILIPTEEPLDENNIKGDTPWFLQSSSESEKNQKIDLSLDEDTGDLMLSGSNDISLSYGMSNAIQAVKLKLSINEGELRRHKEYGLTEIQGLTNTDMKAVKKKITESISESIAADNRFERIERLDVYDLRAMEGTSTGLESNALYIVLTVRIAGSEAVVPISFRVNL